MTTITSTPLQVSSTYDNFLGPAVNSSLFHRAYTQASEIHTHNTRFASNLNFHRPKANNNYGSSTFAFVSSKLWETIPTNFKKLPYTSFYNQYKLYSVLLFCIHVICLLLFSTYSLSMLCHPFMLFFLFLLMYIIYFSLLHFF